MQQVFILAAGEGQRMRPLTLTTPKPLLVYKGKPLLTHILDRLDRLTGVERVIINAAYLGDQIEQFVKTQQNLRGFEIICSREQEPLDTGGALSFAASLMDKDRPLLCISGDSYWPDRADFLADFCGAYDLQKYDFFIGLQDKKSVRDGAGDYAIVDDRPIRTVDKSGAYMFNSIRIINPQIIPNRKGKWSQLELMDTAQAKGKLGHKIMQGWVHVSEPKDLEG